MNIVSTLFVGKEKPSSVSSRRYRKHIEMPETRIPFCHVRTTQPPYSPTLNKQPSYKGKTIAVNLDAGAFAASETTYCGTHGCDVV